MVLRHTQSTKNRRTDTWALKEYVLVLHSTERPFYTGTNLQNDVSKLPDKLCTQIENPRHELCLYI
jgi:hypothetical protein